MTEDEARRWVSDRYPRQFRAIAAFLDMVIDENHRQNLIAPSTVDIAWTRHVVDSLQLSAFGLIGGNWLDIGSGGGFPGIPVAIVRDSPIILVEPRRKRADFLRSAARALKLDNLEVRQQSIENAAPQDAAVISARAVASLGRLFDMARRWSVPTTRWILPRGQVSDDDMALLHRRFDKMFHVERSLTSPLSTIVIADGSPV